ncbi:hypothetical protein [Pseudooceanicola sp.]|uniref:hypothetical protein n=1 Tax=Pseudooceanicola sp. TaxID=1914328 RepID=UPI0035C73A03
MQLLYEHRSPPRTGRKVALIITGALMVVALLIFPPEGLVTTWSLWALACALQLAGVGLLALPPVIHLWITRREIIIHPTGPVRRLPIQHIHDMELSGTEEDPVLTLHLRNGEELDLSDWTDNVPEVMALLAQLGVARRDA